MNRVCTIAVFAAASLGASSVMAECPVYLQADQLVECIVTEGADGKYSIPADVAFKVAMENSKNKTAAADKSKVEAE